MFVYVIGVLLSLGWNGIWSFVVNSYIEYLLSVGIFVKEVKTQSNANLLTTKYYTKEFLKKRKIFNSCQNDC